MVAVPGITPVTIPDALPIVATLLFMLYHVPPAVVVDNVVLPDELHIVRFPLIDGNGFTVKAVVIADALHPLVSVTDTEYTPAAADVNPLMKLFWLDAENEFGPLHAIVAYAPLPPVGVEFSEIAPPVHSGFGVTVTVIAGLGAMLTVVVALPVNPLPSTTVIV